MSKRQKRYNEQVAELFVDYNSTMAGYSARVVQLLKDAQKELTFKIQTMSQSDWLAVNLSGISEDLNKVLDDFKIKYDANMLAALDDSANKGMNIIVQPLKDNLDTSLMIQEPLVFQPLFMDANVRATWNISATLISDATEQTAKNIMDKLIIGMVTEEPRQAVVDSIIGELGGERLGFKTLDERGWAIYRTETSRMFSIASDLQMRQSIEFLPGAHKTWHHGVMAGAGQTPRPGHQALDGESIPYQDSFENPVTGWLLLYPHDPQAPASESVHCGCAHTLSMPDEKFLRQNTLVNV